MVARAEGFEPPTNGFGDHYSTVELRPYAQTGSSLIDAHATDRPTGETVPDKAEGGHPG